MKNPSDQVSVRRATADDVTQLVGLLALLFAQETDFSPDAKRQVTGLRLILEQPEVGQIFCAVVGGDIVGMVSILFTVSTAEGGRVAWLEDMVVQSDRRNEGVGELLIREALQGARSAGCKRITLLTDDTNHAAMRFYARSGFVRSRMVPFRLKL